MGRLDNIVQRNKQPFRLKGSRGMLVRGLFLLLILALFLFSSWAKPPPDNRPGINVVPSPPQPPKEKAVHGVKLWKAPKK